MDDQAATEKLAAALCVIYGDVIDEARPAAAALLPVVREIAADELRAAAGELRDCQARATVKASDMLGAPVIFDREVGRAAGYGAAAQIVAERADGLTGRTT